MVRKRRGNMRPDEDREMQKIRETVDEFLLKAASLIKKARDENNAHSVASKEIREAISYLRKATNAERRWILSQPGGDGVWAEVPY